MNEDKRRVIEYLQAKVDDGTEYFRSKNIAEDLGLSAKQVGAHLGRHDDDGELHVEKHARSRSTTWAVSRADN